MKAIVTGAAGFLGRHVARAFRDSGWDVTGFDLTEFEEAGVRSVQGDLTNPESIIRAVNGNEAVVHIGAIGDVYLAGERPELAARVNVEGTAHVIDAAVKSGSRLIYASTWEVYGEPISEPVDESHPTAPDHPYSITKLAGESLVLAATHLKGLSALSLRLGTAYGSGLRPNSVFRIFLDNARRREPITIQGDGSQGRQFTHASDIARAFELAAMSEESGSAFNIVDNQTTTIRKLAELIVKRYPTEVNFGPPRPGDVAPALVSAEKAADVLGWKPAVAFERGLDEFITSVEDAP